MPPSPTCRGGRDPRCSSCPGCIGSEMNGKAKKNLLVVICKRGENATETLLTHATDLGKRLVLRVGAVDVTVNHASLGSERVVFFRFLRQTVIIVLYDSPSPGLSYCYRYRSTRPLITANTTHDRAMHRECLFGSVAARRPSFQFDILKE